MEDGIFGTTAIESLYCCGEVVAVKEEADRFVEGGHEILAEQLHGLMFS